MYSHHSTFCQQVDSALLDGANFVAGARAFLARQWEDAGPDVAGAMAAIDLRSAY